MILKPQNLQLIIFLQNMFDRTDSDHKFEQYLQERTAAQFGETQDESFVYEVEAEKQYVQRLKNQREKIEALYSKYDVLLKDLKAKDSQLRQKDKTISSLQAKCKALATASQESTIFRQQSHSAQQENQSLQRAVAELEESYAYLHGQLRSKEAVSTQKLEELQLLNEDLMGKLRALNKKYQEREEDSAGKQRELIARMEELKAQSRKQKDEHVQEEELLRAALLQKDEQIRLLQTENQCLKERIRECEGFLAETTYEHQERMEHFQKERKLQLRALKGEIEALRENSATLEKRWQKARDELQMKDLSLSELSILAEQREKEANEALSLLRQQSAQEKALLKEQLLHCENHIAKLERKIADSVRKEQCLHGKIKKYEVCLDAKRNLREIEKEELERINLLLNLPS